MGPPARAPKSRPKKPKGQTTLTQIDFVTRLNPAPDLDLDLDYIEDVPNPPRMSRNRTKEKARVERHQDNTLTQMDYVARRPSNGNAEELGEDMPWNDMPHVPGTDDEDDDDLERVGTAPRWEVVQDQNNLTPSPERRAKRRRLENAAHIPPASFQSKGNQTQKGQVGREKENIGHGLARSHNQPPTDTVPSLHPTSQGRTTLHATPKKQQKWEIPSSQSPDSPGFIMIEDSPRSPLKTKSLNIPPAPFFRRSDRTSSPAKIAPWSSSHSKDQPKGTVPGSPITVESRCTPETCVSDSETPGTSPMPVVTGEARKASSSQQQPPLDTNPTSHEKPCGSGGVYISEDANIPKTSTDHVVCETDAESEDEFPDNHPLPEQDSHPHPTDPDTHSGMDSGNTHSAPEPEMNSHPNPDGAGSVPDYSTAITDASIFYHRRPQDYPRDPTASELDVDSERLAELFPPHEQETIGPTLPPYSNSESTQQQHSSTRNPLDISTEFVPESSQRPGQDERNEIPHSSPPEVILVESSQPGDQPTQAKTKDSHSESRDIFNTSQLLPDSLMESIPRPPPECLFSDDSIHE